MADDLQAPDWLAGIPLPGSAERARQAQAQQAAGRAERIRRNEERRRMFPEVARQEDAAKRYYQGEPARTDEERGWYRTWAELDADLIEDYREQQHRERQADLEAGE